MIATKPTIRLRSLAVLVVLAGCASGGDPQSGSYQAGYSDGCATAQAQASRTGRAPERDAVLYESDANYRAGWLSGRATCAPPPSATGR